jgi:hypothetical protein
MLCTQAANGDSAFHTKLRLNVCELKAHATLDCTGRRHIASVCNAQTVSRNSNVHFAFENLGRRCRRFESCYPDH